MKTPKLIPFKTIELNTDRDWLLKTLTKDNVSDRDKIKLFMKYSEIEEKAIHLAHVRSIVVKAMLKHTAKVHI